MSLLEQRNHLLLGAAAFDELVSVTSIRPLTESQALTSSAPGY